MVSNFCLSNVCSSTSSELSGSRGVCFYKSPHLLYIEIFTFDVFTSVKCQPQRWIEFHCPFYLNHSLSVSVWSFWNILTYCFDGRCHATIDFSFNPLSARNRALSCITTFPRSFHSSTSEDDTFSELGSPVPKAPTHARKLKLMTEKPEPYLVCS